MTVLRLTPAMDAYLAAFDAFLMARPRSRDDQLVADLKSACLEHLVAQRHADPEAFLAHVPPVPRGKQGGRARPGR